MILGAAGEEDEAQIPPNIPNYKENYYNLPKADFCTSLPMGFLQVRDSHLTDQRW